MIEYALITALSVGLVVVVGLYWREKRRSSSSNDEVCASAALFERTFEAFPDAAMVTRLRDGKILAVNEGFVERTGFSRDQVVGGYTPDMWEYPESRAKMVELVRATGRVRNLYFRGRRADGSLRDCRFSAETVEINGEPHLVSVIQDISHIRNLQREVLQATVAERERLAIQLHDGVAQDLAAVGLLLGLAEVESEGSSDGDRERIETLGRLLDRAMGRVRAIAHTMAPLEVAQGRLVEALDKLRNDIALIYDVQTTIQAVDDELWRKSLVTGLYHFVREAALGAIKHGGCQNITVIVQPQEQDQISLSIMFDGHGIDPGGDAFRQVQHRAKLLDGTISFNYHRGSGGSIRCVVPALRSLHEAKTEEEPTTRSAAA